MLYSAFLSLLIVSLREKFKYIEVVLTVIAIKISFMYTPLLKNISGGWSMIIIMIISSLIYAFLHYKDGIGEQNE